MSQELKNQFEETQEVSTMFDRQGNFKRSAFGNATRLKDNYREDDLLIEEEIKVIDNNFDFRMEESK